MRLTRRHRTAKAPDEPEFTRLADILSLSKARKAKARAGKDAQAAENRVKFGRTKAEKAKAAAEKSITEKIIDAHKRDTP